MLRTPFNDDWTFTKEDVPGSSVPVTLPHDAMIREVRDPNLPGGQNTGYFPGGRYRYSKTFQAPESETAILEFEGVFHRSKVLLNGTEVGGRPSGYATFHVPLTTCLQDGENLIEVVVDTTDQPNSRWYTGSGIYRPVSLLTASSVHIEPFGFRLLTDSTSSESALIQAIVDVANEEDRAQELTITVTLSSPTGKKTTAKASLTVPSRATGTFRLPITVNNPELWSPENPALYQAEATVRSGRKTLDREEVTTGIRSVTVDAENGLQLNGQTINLRGACIHHDNGVLGAAEFDAAAERRVRRLLDAGYNAIRSSHNPTSNAVLRACDKLGMLVMDEFSDAWYFPKQVGDYGNDFDKWWQRDLDAMVLRDANHPSVIMYSIGNEISETSQPRGIELSNEMTARIRNLDATRPLTNGINLILNAFAQSDEKREKQLEKARTQGEDQNKNLIVLLNYAMGAMERIMPLVGGSKKADALSRDSFAPLDIAGYNYAPFRYRKDGELYPDRVIVGSETNPPDIAENWAMVEELPYLIGDFQWTGWDYLGEAGIAVKRYNQPRAMFLPYPALLAGEPVIDILGNSQTQMYLNRIAYGLEEGPVLAVQPVNHAGEKQSSTPWRFTNSIRSWAWEGYEGTIAVVEVYANAHMVYLLLNGERIGSASIGKKEGYTTTFEVPYTEGTLEAVAYDAAGRELGRDRLRSASSDLRLTLESDRDNLAADGQDLAHVSIAFTDSSGVVRPLADRPVRVRVDGAGVLAGSGSANPITEDRYTTGRFTTYGGRGLAIIRSTGESGEVRVSVEAEGVSPTSLMISAE
ncbi:glycoside hydrolase family 2 TIM barrel-domain containing protein [Actinomycetaceae bacterium MB13-C1-2]|nr:glycoside hydrolase family 2 TIM barrel-domain containing protein [Actinomycetaceae bacterium MB13-C1-2]